MNQEKSRTKFRKNALEEIASSKSLDDLIKITSPKAWVSLIAFILIIVAIILWSIFGIIETQVHGVGILIAEKASLKSVITPEQSGYIASINVHPGSTVTKGMIIAKLTSPSLEDQIKAAQQHLQKLNSMMSNLEQTSKKAITNFKQENSAKRKSLMRILKIEISKKKPLKDLLISKQIAFKKGIIFKESLVNTQIDSSNLLRSIAQHKKDLVDLQIAENKFIDQWKERLRELQIKINEQKNHLRILKGKEKLAANIYSPDNGVVIHVQVKNGNYVEKGKAIMTLVTKTTGLDAHIYVNAVDAKHIKAGMKAQVIPTIIKKLEYGGIVGKVLAISSYPATPEELKSSLKNQSIVKKFIEKGPVFLVNIQLSQDPTTFSGYEWTSSKGPQRYITQGTLVTADIIIKKQTPISLLIPRIEGMIK